MCRENQPRSCGKVCPPACVADMKHCKATPVPNDVELSADYKRGYIASSIAAARAAGLYDRIEDATGDIVADLLMEPCSTPQPEPVTPPELRVVPYWGGKAFVYYGDTCIGNVNALHQAQSYANPHNMAYTKPLPSDEDAVQFLVNSWKKHRGNPE